MSRPLLLGLAATLLFADLPAAAQTPQAIDLFADAPRLGSKHVRIGVWNLRHIDVDPAAAAFLSGATREADFAILIATFAKAIDDLSLDALAVVEVQPRAGESDRLLQIRDRLNAGIASQPWSAEQTAIAYDDPTDPHGNLQFGLLWDRRRISVDPAADVLLEDLRQPRNANGVLLNRKTRAPWLVPVTAGQLSLDLMVLHLKSGGADPQPAEVAAITSWIKARAAQPGARPLVVLGDWNMRPDQPDGRTRLKAMAVPAPGGPLMRVLTVEEVPPPLDVWAQIAASNPAAGLLPFTHFNPDVRDTFLDHVAIAKTLAPSFAHPVPAELADATSDWQPGIAVARPMIPETDYNALTDHLPVVLILATGGTGGGTPGPAALRIAAVLPNPPGDDAQNEKVILRNAGTQAVSLAGWRLEDAENSIWALDAVDGSVAPGGTQTVVRRGRPMSLNNAGDTLVLRDPAGLMQDVRTYGAAAAGALIQF